MPELTERLELLERRDREREEREQALIRQVQRWRFASLLGVAAALVFAPLMVEDAVAYWKERDGTGARLTDGKEGSRN